MKGAWADLAALASKASLEPSVTFAELDCEAEPLHCHDYADGFPTLKLFRYLHIYF